MRRRASIYATLKLAPIDSITSTRVFEYIKKTTRFAHYLTA